MRISDLSSDVCSSDLAGHIAINAGIAGGADVILIPELPYSLAGIAAKIESLKTTGRNFALVVVAEAVKMENGAAVRQQIGREACRNECGSTWRPRLSTYH